MNRKLFLESKVESCSIIKEGKGRLAMGEDEVRRIILRIYIV